MATEGGWVQLEQSDMRLALNVAKMTKRGFSSTAINEMNQLIKIPRAEVGEAKNWWVKFAGHKKVKAEIERHVAMICETQTDSCLPGQHGTAKNPRSCLRRIGTGAPPPQPVPPRPKTPPAPPGDTEQNQSTEIEGAPPGYVYIHTSLPNAQFFNHDAYAKDRKHNKDFIPDLLTDQRPSTS